jgi:hypothetical protein
MAGFCRRFGLRAAAVYGMSEIGAVLDGPPETVVGGEAGFAREEYQLRVVDSEVERVINEHPAVFESAVVGVPAELTKTPTQKVHKHLLRERGAGREIWDREAAGIVLRRGSR